MKSEKLLSLALLFFAHTSSCMQENQLQLSPAHMSNEKLFIAVERKDISTIKQLLSSGECHANSIGKHDDHIFPHATMHSNVECMKLLITYGADINKPRKYNTETPLHIAAKNGDTEKVKLLLKHGAYVYPKTSNTGSTALHLAILDDSTNSLIIMHRLLKAKADPNATNRFGETALHQCISNNLGLQQMELLLQHEAKTDILNNQGASPFHVAVRRAHLPAIRLLLKYGANIDHTTANGDTPLELARTAHDAFLFKQQVITLLTLLTIPVEDQL